MSGQTPITTTEAQLKALKALVRAGELAASKIKRITGVDAVSIMEQLAANGWKWLFSNVPALKSDRLIGIKPVYQLSKSHRKLAVKWIQQKEANNDEG